MGFRFTGLFANEPPAQNFLLWEVLRTWPIARGRYFYKPFQGFGIVFPDYQESSSDEAAEKILELIDSAQERLPALSRDHPQFTFMWLEAECFGGTCFYEGFVCKSGEIQVEARGDGALTKLLAHFNVRLDECEYFAPLERGFFAGGKKYKGGTD